MTTTGRRKATAVTAALTLLLGLIAFIAPAQTASAADASDFNAGNIISDEQFFDGAAMSAQDIQNFLVAQVPVCRSSYACLSTYSQNTPTIAGTAGRCDTYVGQANESAASIIARVGMACGISQKALLVLLEKEQSLVTSSTPGQGRFESATGMGCPDTAPCDPGYGGFMYQVYYAAKQFKIYSANPTYFNHIAGRVNNIRFSPDASCGSSPVLIVNQATAGLYNYTPYQPNAAALNNLYGTGDGCSAYGNRNFWRIYSDWFGSPTVGSALVRTEANPSVFLVSGSVKYPISNMGLIASYSALGQVGFVSQGYLDKYPTKQPANRIVRSDAGAIFFIDSGMKLPIPSCGLVVDYGGSCSPGGYTQLTDAQVSSFVSGPGVTPVMGTTAGGRYYITVGSKREILDARSQSEAGIPAPMNVLSENAVADLSVGSPIFRDSAYVSQRGAADYFLLAGGRKTYISAGSETVVGIPGRSAGSLSSSSLSRIPSAGAAFSGVVRAPGNTTNSVLSTIGRLDVPGGTPVSALPYTSVTDEFLQSYPRAVELKQGSFFKGTNSSSVYMLDASSMRPVGSWEALVSLSPGGNPSITSMAPPFMSTMSTGPAVLRVASLARTASNGTIYIIDGISKKVALDSFDPASEAGVSGFSYVTDAQLAAYADQGTVRLGYELVCGAVTYVAGGGELHALDANTAQLYPLPSTSLDSLTCSALSVGKPATSFIRTPDGSIYVLQGGKKLPIASLSRYNELGGATVGYTSVSARLAALIPSGPRA
ncbi:hypothetical protein SAMN06295879_1803 [Agreia bicolorata]|uniref:Hemagglutinin-related protein n=1 Tax=Agreia bicolorata TaxID=110935 RepID=A0A1T4XW22_9MICO|nr:hypothetical protein [Agreia bicolorata]SKA93769.1 hypothetical protein SAMN06295879_1803 [Agreia bicolorata]